MEVIAWEMTPIHGRGGGLEGKVGGGSIQPHTLHSRCPLLPPPCFTEVNEQK